MKSYGVTIQMKPLQQYFHLVLYIKYVVLTLSLWVYSYSVAIQMKTSSLCSPFFFKDIGVPDSQTVNSSSMAFHKFKTKPLFHSSTLKTYYSKNVFVECSVFEFLASYVHFIRLVKRNKFSISVTVLLLSVHPVRLYVRPSIHPIRWMCSTAVSASCLVWSWCVFFATISCIQWY